MQAAPTVDRRMAAARMQCDEQIVVAVFVCLGDGNLMTKFFEDARPSQRCYAVAVSGPGRRRGSDEDLHRSFESAQAPKPAQRSRRSGVLTNGCYRWLAKQLRGFETAAPKQLFRKFIDFWLQPSGSSIGAK
jgi:hypothetical protein